MLLSKSIEKRETAIATFLDIEEGMPQKNLLQKRWAGHELHWQSEIG